MNDQTTNRWQSVTERVIDRASRDPQFRQELLQNPLPALKQELGVTIPANIDIRVVEETPSMLYLVLPPETAAPGRELSDRELEQVAGGWSNPTECGSWCPAGMEGYC
jgi:hypothetical protein